MEVEVVGRGQCVLIRLHGLSRYAVGQNPLSNELFPQTNITLAAIVNSAVDVNCARNSLNAATALSDGQSRSNTAANLGSFLVLRLNESRVGSPSMIWANASSVTSNARIKQIRVSRCARCCGSRFARAVVGGGAARGSGTVRGFIVVEMI